MSRSTLERVVGSIDQLPVGESGHLVAMALRQVVPGPIALEVGLAGVPAPSVGLDDASQRGDGTRRPGRAHRATTGRRDLMRRVGRSRGSSSTSAQRPLELVRGRDVAIDAIVEHPAHGTDASTLRSSQTLVLATESSTTRLADSRPTSSTTPTHRDGRADRARSTSVTRKRGRRRCGRSMVVGTVARRWTDGERTATGRDLARRQLDAARPEALQPVKHRGGAM